MAPKVSISVLVVAWVLAAGFVAASESSAALELEAKAVLESEWWVAIPTKAIATGMELSAMMKAASRRLKWVGSISEMISKTQSESRVTKNGNLFSIWPYDGKIAYEDIMRVTKDFDIRYYIGTGGYGSIYKTQLPSGKVVALKKLPRLEAKDPTFGKSFKNKNDTEAMELDWTKRVNIIKGIAHGISYMHHECILVIVHQDITSNNILLNIKLEAFVFDFGTARLLYPDSSNQTLVVGTYSAILLVRASGSSSSLEHEAEALLESEIKPPRNFMVGDEFGKLNFSSFPNLVRLYLSGNRLQGSITAHFGVLSKLMYFNLSSNNMTDLSHNRLVGHIPTHIGNCNNLKHLSLNNNSLNGSIPAQVGSLSLLYIDISHKVISGRIAHHLGELTSLEFLNLSHNNLSGTIPDFLNSMTQISSIDLSYNNLEGKIPHKFKDRYPQQAIIGNKGLRGEFKGMPSCLTSTTTDSEEEPERDRFHFSTVILYLLFYLSIFGYLYIFLSTNDDVESERTVNNNGDLLSIWNYDGRIAYEDIIKATEDFNIKYCIGTGGFSYTMVMAEKGDAYSFGVVALETIMGMHPGELLSSLSPSSSNQDVKLKDVLDPRLSPPTDKRGCTRYCPCCNNSICMLTFQPKVPTNHGKCVSRIYFSQSNIGETFP
ncbi:mdis1-interacting receptor like kinase 2 [Quercus suber]|uniref:non-specific serine/threonine protein kinase n=1 Tax=Quercus suber TaxID=58331 RepID=A0AAW0MEC4_QUESU